MTRQERIDFIRAVLKLFGDDGEHWIKQAWARDDDGHEVSTHDPSATCFCLEGGFGKVSGTDPSLSSIAKKGTKYNEMVILYEQYIHREHNNACITAFNDDPNIEWEDVKNSLKEFIQFLEILPDAGVPSNV